MADDPVKDLRDAAKGLAKSTIPGLIGQAVTAGQRWLGLDKEPTKKASPTGTRKVTGGRSQTGKRR